MRINIKCFNCLRKLEVSNSEVTTVVQNIIYIKYDVKKLEIPIIL